jgi:hypothetical protein
MVEHCPTCQMDTCAVFLQTLEFLSASHHSWGLCFYHISYAVPNLLFYGNLMLPRSRVGRHQEDAGISDTYEGFQKNEVSA